VSDPRARFRVIPHTADLGVELRAPAPARLFECAGRALFSILVEGRRGARPFACVRIEAADFEGLLVEWLNELLYLHTVGGWVASRFKVALQGQSSLQAQVAGERFEPRRHRVRREIKAATFHGLKLRRAPDAWTARVIFDL
jgi:SHS2 domain-containing protein